MGFILPAKPSACKGTVRLGRASCILSLVGIAIIVGFFGALFLSVSGCAGPIIFTPWTPGPEAGPDTVSQEDYDQWEKTHDVITFGPPGQQQQAQGGQAGSGPWCQPPCQPCTGSDFTQGNCCSGLCIKGLCSCP